MGGRLLRCCKRGRSYRRRNPSPSPSSSSQETRERKRSKIVSWGHFLPKHLRRLSSRFCKSMRSYRRISEDNSEHHKPTPKGYLPVYIGSEGSEPKRRVLVPIIVFNHPLFVELMKRTEEEFGFRHQGGITIPCPSSDFDSVWTLVAGDNTCNSYVEDIRFMTVQEQLDSADYSFI